MDERAAQPSTGAQGERRADRVGVTPLDLMAAELRGDKPKRGALAEEPLVTGADARRYGAALWALQAALLTVFVIGELPARAIGGAGWAVLAALILPALAIAALLHAHPDRVRVDLLYGLSFAAVAQLGVAVWLSQEASAVAGSFALIWLIFVPLASSLRAAAAFIGFTAAVALAPLAYLGWDIAVAADLGSRFVVSLSLAGLAVAWVRTQGERQAELERSGREAEQLAHVDPLTALPNRRAFDRDLIREVEIAESTGKPLTLVLADVHGFNEINDMQGYTAGDRHLKGVATRMREVLREGDGGYRWGGDEFALLLPRADLHGARRVCDRLGMLMLDERSVRFGTGVQLRFGIAEHHGGRPAEELTESADLHLIAARRGFVA